MEKKSLREHIVEDRGGDALDSVIAAYVVFRALSGGFAFDTSFPHALEGRVYV